MRILYEVGRRYATVGAGLIPRPRNVIRADASYKTNAVLLEDFVGLAKKYSNFSANFEYSSLVGVVERIGLGGWSLKYQRLQEQFNGTCWLEELNLGS
ncbi:Major capsid protein [Golovinomyces cichoracearum]|uniref:Major capsid protein n=1 Tax=Golovinomyces cichoracearum TaxID=62708 RepID=A0A420IPL9_9PEZI|nr:Major capsid protein [Golovinomyces cichoracearum]